MIRFLDIVVVLLSGIVFVPAMIVIAIAIKLTSRGPILYWSDRVGQDNAVFKMPKFRTMSVDTPAVATRLLSNPGAYLTPIGGFLRRNSLDELPQLWPVLVGKMSLVGPRPVLYNEHDLIELRTKMHVHKLKPGITGWAQVNGRDRLTVKEKVAYEMVYLRNKSFLFNVRILILTFIRVVTRHGISH